MTNEELVAGFREYPSAYITDAMLRLGVAGWTEGVYPLSKTNRRIAGRAVTVEYGPKRNSGSKPPSIMQIIRQCQPGDVLVIAAQGTPCWILGSNLARATEIQGTAGLIIDGCVRDVAEISEMAMPLFCRGGGSRPFATHLELTNFNVPVQFAGTQIRPGDILVGDADGLVIVPAERAEEVLYQAGDIDVYEKEARAGIERVAPLSELGAIIARKHTVRK